MANQSQKMKSRTAIERRNIVVVGKTGAGKSSVANSIMVGPDGQGPFAVSKPGTCTMHSQLTEGYFRKDSKTYDVKCIDTAGLFDTRAVRNKTIINELKRFVRDKMPEGVSIIFFVIKKGRYTQEEDKIFDFLINNFCDDLSTISALVITNCDGMTTSASNELIEDWKKSEKTKKITSFMQRGIYTVGFPDFKLLNKIFVPILMQAAVEDAERLRHVVCTASDKMSLQWPTYQDNPVKDLQEQERVLGQRVREAERQLQEAQEVTRQLQELAGASEQREQKANERAQLYQSQVRESSEKAQQCETQLQEANKRAQEYETQAHKANEKAQQSEKRLRDIEKEVRYMRHQYAKYETQLQKANETVQEANKRAQEYETQAHKANEKAQQYEERLRDTKIEVRQYETQLHKANEAVQNSKATERDTLQQLDKKSERKTKEDDSLKTQWVVQREEIQLTEEELGRGGWAAVKVAKFRGTRVAAKCLFDVIVSEYNCDLFRREMNMASRIRHPNLVQFIGATQQGKMIILTELMPTSLRAVLEQRAISHDEITSISLDVARALNYLHLMKPDPVVHRDISSANVLLEPLPNNSWKAKVSDYGSVNLLNSLKTEAPGNLAYAAPEASIPTQQSPKMDIFSFGVLLIEMCTHKFPDVNHRKEQIESITYPRFLSTTMQCLNEAKDKRPTAAQLIEDLQQ